MAITLTSRERSVLAYVVLDPDAWIDHAVAVRGEEQARADLDAKMSRWAPAYAAAVAAEGEEYQTRAEREAA